MEIKIIYTVIKATDKESETIRTFTMCGKFKKIDAKRFLPENVVPFSMNYRTKTFLVNGAAIDSWLEENGTVTEDVSTKDKFF